VRQVAARYLAGVGSSRGLLVELAEVVLLAIGLYLVINFAVQTVHVMGSSMYPTVRNQDYLLATKIDYRLHAPQRGDIVIMRDPLDPSRDFIKRIIAVPGDRVLIRDGHVYVNGRQLQEGYLHGEMWTQYMTWPAAHPSNVQGQPMGSDQYFVMGDNRDHSDDSRIFGPIHRDEIEARAWIRVVPLSQLGPIDGSKPTLSPNVTVPNAS
jgi:signal peptidase I